MWPCLERNRRRAVDQRTSIASALNVPDWREAVAQGTHGGEGGAFPSALTLSDIAPRRIFMTVERTVGMGATLDNHLISSICRRTNDIWKKRDSLWSIDQRHKSVLV